MQKGIILDFGIFSPGGRGYALIEADDQVELARMFSRYRDKGVRAVMTEPVISLEQYAKLGSK